jgi:two-component system response regulator
MPDLPGLILLDLKMPKVNGIEVLQRVKSDDRTKFIPVVVFTSSQEDPDVKECYQLGVNSYIVKPLEFDAFAKVIKDAGMYWVLINHLPQE